MTDEEGGWKGAAPRVELKRNGPSPPRRHLLKWNRRLLFFTCLSLSFSFYLLFLAPPWSTTPASRVPQLEPQDEPLTAEAHGSAKKVALEAYIMQVKSKCPDARDCLHDLILPTMFNISDKVDFKLSYIAEPGSDEDDVSCKHGPSECLGNIIELCAASLYPSPKTYLGFTMCLTDSYSDIPSRSLVNDCALDHDIDFDKLNDCLSQDDGSFGMDMLRKSAEHSIKDNVSISCTVKLAEDVWCIRDGGEWKDCKRGHTAKSLIHDINELYNSSRKS